VDRHALALSPARGASRKFPRAWRRAARREPHVARRCAPASRLGRSSRPLYDVQGHLRPAVHQAVRENGGRDSDFLAAPPARHDHVPPRRQRCHQKRRSRLHLRRRPDHPHRPAASLPPRPRTHHERRRCADHSRLSRRRVGQHLQLRTRPLPVETSAPHSVSDHRQFRKADAGDRERIRSSRSRAGAAERFFHAPSRANENAHALLRSHGPHARFPICDG
jgi:hypothetical protein